jgi:hypothetical protein
MHRLVPLRYAILLPSGWRRRPAPTLDTTGCTLGLKVTSGRGPSAWADISGGAVTVAQAPGRQVETRLTIERRRCDTRALNSPVRDPRVRVAGRRRRHLPARVLGRFSTGASRGTDWTTIDGCTSTTTVVHKGRVQVYDRVKRRTFVVRAGGRYVARARASG